MRHSDLCLCCSMASFPESVFSYHKRSSHFGLRVHSVSVPRLMLTNHLCKESIFQLWSQSEVWEGHEFWGDTMDPSIHPTHMVHRVARTPHCFGPSLQIRGPSYVETNRCWVPAHLSGGGETDVDTGSGGAGANSTVGTLPAGSPTKTRLSLY